MSINHITNPFIDGNRWYVKYSVVFPDGHQELRPVSFRTLEEAKSFYQHLTTKQKQNV